MSSSETSTATQPIPDAELGDIEENLRAGHEYTDSAKLDDADRLQNDLVGREWELALAELRARAKTSKLNADDYRRLLLRYRRLLDRMYEALHENRYRSEKEDVPRYFWQRQRFDLLHFDDEMRGFSIFKESLLEAAAWYLSEPDLRTSRADWVFLDAIIFCELELVADEVFTRRSGTGFNWALVLANRKPWIYIALMPVFWLLGFALRFVALPAGAYFLFIKGHETGAIAAAVIWALYLVLALVGLPFRVRARHKGKSLVKRLMEIYRLLGETTISPRKLKQALDAAADSGVVLDGAVFGITDRIAARDPTAFIPNPVG